MDMNDMVIEQPILLDVAPGGGAVDRDNAPPLPRGLNNTVGLDGAAGGNWCFGAIGFCAYRITQLNSNGTAWNGTGHGIANNQVIDGTIEPEYDEGTEATQKNGCGALCQTYKDCDKLKAFNLAINLCALDAHMMRFLMGGYTFLDTTGAGVGDAIGYEFPGLTDPCGAGVCVEFWQRAWDGSAQAAPPFAGGSVVYIHWVFPKVIWKMTQLTMEDDFSVIPFEGYGTANLRISANGPYDDWPADIAMHGGIRNAGGWFFDTVLPTAACAPITVTSAAS